MADANDRTADELMKAVYSLSDGRTPAGVLELVQSFLNLAAVRAGAGLLLTSDEYRPAGSNDTSGRAIVTESRHLHHVEQDSAQNPERTAERDQAIAADHTAHAAALHAEGVRELLAVLAEAAAKGYSVAAVVSPATEFAGRV